MTGRVGKRDSGRCRCLTQVFLSTVVPEGEFVEAGQRDLRLDDFELGMSRQAGSECAGRVESSSTLLLRMSAQRRNRGVPV
jgi:hypothetical protein